METKNMIGKVVGITVALICVAVILMPVLSDATTTEKTFDNTADALWQVDKLDSDSEYVFEWTYEDPTNATVNGKTVALTNGTLVCAADTFLLRYGLDSTGYYLQSVPGSTFNVIVYSAGTNQGNLTVEASAGTFTATIETTSTTTSTTTFTEGYGIVADGEYVMKSPTQEAYVLGDSEIFAMGLTAINSVWYNLFQIEGTVDDGVTVNNIYPEGAYTASDISVNATENEDYLDLYELSSITFLATNAEDSSITKDCTYNYFIVPAEVTAELSQHLSAGEIAIIGAIPVMIIVVIVLMSVGLIVSRRD